jgi:hypothetical protein
MNGIGRDLDERAWGRRVLDGLDLDGLDLDGLDSS